MLIIRKIVKKKVLTEASWFWNQPVLIVSTYHLIISSYFNKYYNHLITWPTGTRCGVITV